MVVTVEETRTREIEVDAENFDAAVEIVKDAYERGGIYMNMGGTEVHASIGDEDHQFEEISVWWF